jgi:hypothetical protein
MIVSIFILILFLPAAFLPAAIKTIFTPGELDKMGVRLEGYQSIQGCNDTTHIPDENQCRCNQTILNISVVSV